MTNYIFVIINTTNSILQLKITDAKKDAKTYSLPPQKESKLIVEGCAPFMFMIDDYSFTEKMEHKNEVCIVVNEKTSLTHLDVDLTKLCVTSTEIIDIVAVIDAETLAIGDNAAIPPISPIKGGGSVEDATDLGRQPGNLADKHIHMITRTSYAVTGSNATADLGIKALKGDIIRWRICSLTANNEYEVFFSKWLYRGGDASIIDPNPPESKPFGDWGQVYQTTAVKTGQLTYSWVFEIKKDNNNNNNNSYSYGYYKWDPFINVSLPGG